MGKIKTILATALISGLLPISAFADNATTTPNKKDRNFCQVLDKKYEGLVKKLEKQVKQNDKFARGKINERIKSADHDQKQILKKVEKKGSDSATTTAQQLTATTTAATEKFKTELQKAVTDLQNALKSALDTKATTTKAIVDKAKADCAAGKNPSEVRTEYHNALKAANDAYKSATKPAKEAFSAIVKQLVSARKATVKEVREQLKALREAKEDDEDEDDDD